METLDKHVESLAGILDKEYKLYKQVLDLVMNEQRTLVNVDMEGLEENLQKQQKLQAKISKLEAKRIEELEVIGIFLGSLPERLRLSAIAQNVEPELGEKLVTQGEHFKSIISEILRLNKSNKYLIDRSLQFIEKNVQAFFGAIEDKGLYNPKIQKPAAKADTRRMVDWKA